MIPEGLTLDHFEMAAKEIDRNGVPHHRASVHYDLLLKGRKYPPKYVISLATKYLSGQEWSSLRFNAVEAKKYFESRGFEIVDRREGAIDRDVAIEDDESAYPEGLERYRLHRTKERDAGISRKAKEKRLKQTGALRCEVCDFSFLDAYGELGEGFIEAHHTVPVSKLAGERKTKISELALVCSNCHRMLHRANPALTIAELRKLVAEKNEATR